MVPNGPEHPKPRVDTAFTTVCHKQSQGLSEQPVNKELHSQQEIFLHVSHRGKYVGGFFSSFHTDSQLSIEMLNICAHFPCPVPSLKAVSCLTLPHVPEQGIPAVPAARTHWGRHFCCILSRPTLQRRVVRQGQLRDNLPSSGVAPDNTPPHSGTRISLAPGGCWASRKDHPLVFLLFFAHTTIRCKPQRGNAAV